MNFQQLKKKKFRGFSTHFVVFRELVRLFTKYKKWERHIYMILFNFSKNAAIFKTSYIYQSTKYKKTWFLYVTSNKDFLEFFSDETTINKMKNMCEYCDLLELWSA